MQARALHTSIALLAAALLFVVAINWGTRAAGGSDSACYLTEARLLEHGTTHIEQPLIAAAPWPRAEWTFTPAGHVPSPVNRTFIVPICPPGLPIAMAAMRLLRGELFVVPLTGAIAVWLTFLLGRRIDGVPTGAAAAVLLACSPIVLFQVVQPMTDVPAMMWWLLVAVLAIGSEDRGPRPLAAGLAASFAVLTRPNLLPLALVIAAFPAMRRRPVIYVLGLVPGIVLLALLQNAMYGSPFATGYGAASDLFRASHVPENLQRYLRWLISSHTPVFVLALAAPFVIDRRRAAWLGLILSAMTLAVYLPYTVFDDWWYVRFLLPAIPWLIVLTVSVIRRLAILAAPRRAGALVLLAVAALAAIWLRNARAGSAFELVRLERHFLDAGHFAAERLPPDAAVLTVRHSGAVWYYAQRPTLSWDTLEPGSLDRALGFLRSRQLTPFLLLDVAEEPVFRARFEAASPIGRLDWPPLASVGRTVRVYDPADRDRYFAAAGGSRNLSRNPPVQLRVWETSATPFVRFASSPSLPPSRF